MLARHDHEEHGDDLKDTGLALRGTVAALMKKGRTRLDIFWHGDQRSTTSELFHIVKREEKVLK